MYAKDKTQNKLTQDSINKIMEIYEKRETKEKFSYLAPFEEIKNNDFNLNIPRYVDTFEEEALIDINEVRNNISNIKSELVEVESQLNKYLEELGLGVWVKNVRLGETNDWWI